MPLLSPESDQKSSEVNGLPPPLSPPPLIQQTNKSSSTIIVVCKKRKPGRPRKNHSKKIESFADEIVSTENEIEVILSLLFTNIKIYVLLLYNKKNK